MARILTSALIALPLSFATLATASAFSSTPDVAPIPQPRPQVILAAAAAATPLPANIVTIGVEAQNIPESRRNVRVVGWKFLPDQDEAIAIAGRDHAEPDVQVAAEKAGRVVANASIAELFGVGSAMASAE